MMRPLVLVPLALAGFAALSIPACSSGTAAAVVPAATHSGPIVLSPDGTRLFVVHPDVDVVTALDIRSGSIVATYAPTPATSPLPPSPTVSDTYWPDVLPRDVALDPTGATLFVTGERSGYVYAFAVDSGGTAPAQPTAAQYACAEPIGILVDPSGKDLFVACSNDDKIVELSASTLAPIASAACPRKPWALAWGPNGQLFATHLLNLQSQLSAMSPETGGSGVSVFSASPLAYQSTWALADGPPGDAPTAPHGVVRSVYDLAMRPGTNELWVAHDMLGIDTPQPTLDFQSTVFPAVSVLDAASSGEQTARMTVSGSPGDGNAFGDIVSGPRAITFSPDGDYAFVVDAASEDILVIDARQEVEAALVRPLPGHQPEGAVWGPGNKLYVQERNTLDVAILDVTEQADAGSVTVTVEPTTWKTLAQDKWSPHARLGQHLFNSANSDEYPITSNHWLSCTGCHPEGRSDVVTWRFSPGPRDTPTNAGGVLDTGFLLRTADRRGVQDYWQTIDEEQGGDFSTAQPSQMALLDALADYVNHGIPTPSAPTQSPAEASLAAEGKTLFEGSAGCTNCHKGTARTDSGEGNPKLALDGRVVSSEESGGVLLHDVGTCVTTGAWVDVPHTDIDGNPRSACAYDTPQLRGLVDSAPYFHDGSAATLLDAVQVMLKVSAKGRTVPASEQDALVAYLKSL